MNLAEQISNAQDLKTKKVEVPEWDVTLNFREMSGFQRAEFEQKVSEFGDNDDPKAPLRMMALIIILMSVDDDGNQVFTMDHLDMIADKNFNVVQRVSAAALDLSKLDNDSIEELAGNSGSDQSESSISD